MFTPLFITIGILWVLYGTRGTVTAVYPNRYYLVGMPQVSATATRDAPATREEIEATRLFIESTGFKDVVYDRSTLQEGRRYYWFKATWPLAPRTLKSIAETPVRVYERVL